MCTKKTALGRRVRINVECVARGELYHDKRTLRKPIPTELISYLAREPVSR